MQRILGTFSILTTLLLALAWRQVAAYSRGPPSSYCLTPIPRHITSGHVFLGQLKPQTSAPPYKIAASAADYVAGSVASVTVTISSNTSSDNFEGVVLIAQRMTGDLQQPVGSWSACSFDTNAVQVKYHTAYPQSGVTDNCVTHMENSEKKSLTCSWTPPQSNEGPIKFRATIVKEYSEFWVNINTVIGANRATKTPLTTTLTAMPTRYDCGTNKSCVLYPSYCTSACTHMISFQRLPGNRMRFQAFASYKEYIVMGISQDNEMGEDLYVFAQMNNESGKMEVYTQVGEPHKSAPLLAVNEVTHRQAGVFTSHTGQRYISLQFETHILIRPRKVDNSYLNISYNTQKMYVFLTSGAAVSGVQSFYGHTERPLVSATEINIIDTSYHTYHFTSRSSTSKIHGTLASIAFMLLWPIGTFIAAHMRPNLPERKNRQALWFIMHIVLIVVGFLTGLAALILMVATNKTWKITASAHGSLAVVTLIFGLCNIISGTFRPTVGKKPNRCIFNFFHRGFGYLARICSVAAFWLAITMPGTSSNLQYVGIIIVGVWSGFELFWAAIFGLIRTIQHQRYLSEFIYKRNYNILGSISKSRLVGHGGCLGFFIYLFAMLAIFIAFVVIIWIN